MTIIQGKNPNIAKTTSVQSKKNGQRKLYCKPRLEELGDLRTITLGSSAGWLDSGGSVYSETNAHP